MNIFPHRREKILGVENSDARPVGGVNTVQRLSGVCIAQPGDQARGSAGQAQNLQSNLIAQVWTPAGKLAVLGHRINQLPSKSR